MDNGSSLAVVATVYSAILLPWAFLYLHDFISDRWAPLSRTRLNGRLHLVVVLTPLPYILYYIVLQAIAPEPDYKEMFAAITAAIFSVYHFARTVWGLYQLHCFQTWAVSTALIMESAGYTCCLAPCLADPDPESNLNLEHKQKPPRSLRGLLARVPSASTPPVAKPAVGDAQHKRGSPTPTPPSIATTAAERRARVRTNVDRILVNSSLIDNEFFGSYAPFRLAWTGRLRPLHRKGTFTRWAVSYLVHFGQQWLADCKTAPFPSSEWTARRWNLAAKVWATAVLRMDTECHAYPPWPRLRRSFQGNPAEAAFLDPCEWQKVTSDFNEQLFEKEYVLRQCFTTGRGMPYDCPILDSPEHPLPSHALYRPLIKEAVESLPTRFYDQVENLTPDHLEWFAVFIRVEQWGGCVPEVVQPSESGDLFNASTPPSVPSHSATLLPGDIPVRVLQDQLGLEDPPFLQRCGFPIVNRGYGPMLWDNRSVLQVSARIDNWIALTIGRQVVAMLETEAHLAPSGNEYGIAHQSPLEDGASASGMEGLDSSQGSHAGYRRSTRIINFHKNLEIKRLRYQLANLHPKHGHLEHGLSFMGCVIESTRSGLAESLNMDGLLSDESWVPPVPAEVASFSISEQLRRCLQQIGSMKPAERRFDSSLKERILWECQNGVQWSWHNKRTQVFEDRPPPLPAPQTLEAMLLCILGFPSLHIVEKNGSYVSAGSPENLLYFQISPAAGPQPLQIDVKVDIPTSIMEAKLVCTASECSPLPLEFRWQDWRDAFEGRMIGKSEWQRSHYMRELPIRRTNAKISKGIVSKTIGNGGGGVEQSKEAHVSRKCLVWEGWKPFRAGMTLFELRHSSLIIIGDSMPTDTYHADNTSQHALQSDWPRRTEEVGAYERANMAALTDASVHLDSFLTLNMNLFHGEDDLKMLTDEDANAGVSIPSPFADRASQSSASSDDDPVFRLDFKQYLLPKDAIRKAQQQDALAMHQLAKWVLTGTAMFKKNYDKALLLMERALVLGRNIRTASLLVKTLLDPEKGGEGRAVDLDRALSAVELLWRDIAGRQTVVIENGTKKRCWKGIAKLETERMKKLVALHMKLVKRRPTAEMMRNLGDRLSTWGKTAEDMILATVLYESAVLASQDAKAMMELGKIFHSDDPYFATRMYLRSIMQGCEEASMLLADCLLGGVKHGLARDEIASVYQRAARIGHRGAMRELGLLLLRGEEDLGSTVREKSSVGGAVFSETVARVLERGLQEFRVDRSKAEEVRRTGLPSHGDAEQSANTKAAVTTQSDSLQDGGRGVRNPESGMSYPSPPSSSPSKGGSVPSRGSSIPSRIGSGSGDDCENNSHP